MKLQDGMWSGSSGKWEQRAREGVKIMPQKSPRRKGSWTARGTEEPAGGRGAAGLGRGGVQS